MGWPRRLKLPDELDRRVVMAHGEQPLVAVRLKDEAWALATDRRLVVVDPQAPGDPRTDRAWFEVDTASWDDEAGVLSVSWVSGERSWLTLADPTDPALPTVVRERVESSVVARHRVTVPGRGGARVVVRRAGDQLVTQVLLDPGTDARDPLVADAVRRGRREVAELVGIDFPGAGGLNELGGLDGPAR